MARKGSILVQAGGASHALSLSSRDIHLLDGQYFFRDGWTYRKLFRLDFFRGLKAPPLDVPLVTHDRRFLLRQLGNLLCELETQKDLLSSDYTYSFGDREGRFSGGEAGFRVEGGYGYIDARPAGNCTLKISGEGPNGRGRDFAIIDMRVLRKHETSDRGTLSVHARKASVGWFDKLPALIEFLQQQPDETVEIRHVAIN